jgi:hypothetical protein
MKKETVRDKNTKNTTLRIGIKNSVTGEILYKVFSGPKRCEEALNWGFTHL